MNGLVKIIDALAHSRYSESYMVKDKNGIVWKKEPWENSFRWVMVDLLEPLEKQVVQMEAGPPCPTNPNHSKKELFNRIPNVNKDEMKTSILCLSDLVTDKNFAPVIRITNFLY